MVGLSLGSRSMKKQNPNVIISVNDNNFCLLKFLPTKTGIKCNANAVAAG